jgi:uncharacterized cupredoxin-like copper-binding protein
MHFAKRLLPLALGVVLSGGVQAADYITDAAEIVKKTDWKQMQTVTVELNEFGYHENRIELKAGQPYKMELKNVGEKKHYFTAPEFFKAIATRKVQANGMGEVKAPYIIAMEMLPEGGQLDLYFVPVTKGTYTVYCTIDDHRQQGMEGTLVIQ